MKTEKRTAVIHPNLLATLEQLRQMVRGYIVADFVLVSMLIIGGVFWGGLLLDYGPILLGGLEMPRSARLVLLLGACVAIAIIAGRSLGMRLTRDLPDESLAILLERHHPELGERLITSVQLSQNPDDTFSKALFDRVRLEAAQHSDELDIRRVFQWKPLIRKAVLAGGMFVALIVFAIANLSATKLAFSRLLFLSDEPWPRRSSLEMVGVEVPVISFEETDDSAPAQIKLLEFDKDKSLRLARGGTATLRVRARADDAIVPELCTVQYQTSSGGRGQTNMRRVGRVRDGYQYFALDGPPLDGLAEDVVFTVKGLDDRLPDFRAEAIEPPAITRLDIICYYPNYLRDPGAAPEASDRELMYAPGIRIREGSNLRIVGHCSKPLSKTDVMIKSTDDSSELKLAQISEDAMSFSVAIDDFRDDQTLLVLPVDDFSISAGSPFRYFLGVIKDEAPEVELNLVGIGSAITPVAKVPFRGKATDDYGISRTEFALSTASEESTPPILRRVDVDRDGAFSSELDLRELTASDDLEMLKPGQRLNLFAEATDRYDLQGKHVSQSDFYGLDVVSSDELLGRLERRELGLRSRLEQSIDEIRQLRDVLSRVAKDNWNGDAASGSSTSMVQDDSEMLRAVELRQLRIQQTSLQAAKTKDELSGIAAALADIMLEMENNRVDSVDRRTRIREKVQQPLEQTIGGEVKKLQDDITSLLLVSRDAAQGPKSASNAVESAENVLLKLDAILESMLDLESYNEILEIVRDLIGRLDDIREDTQEEQKKRVLDLFK